MKMNRIIALIALLSCASCTTPRHAVSSPQYSGVVTATEGVRTDLRKIQSDGKEVKKLQAQSLTLLDQLDNKLVKLLDKK